MKLQKLMYLVHGYYLAVTGTPLIDEFFEAWQYGPVVPTTYYDFKQFGRDDIAKGFRATKTYLQPDTNTECREQPTIPEGDEAFDGILKFVFEKYGDKSAIYLSDLTHKVGSPWHQVKMTEPTMRNADIPNDLIREYFQKLV
jgi:uncharacterized phage-associated protein